MLEDSLLSAGRPVFVRTCPKANTLSTYSCMIEQITMAHSGGQQASDEHWGMMDQDRDNLTGTVWYWHRGADDEFILSLVSL